MPNNSISVSPSVHPVNEVSTQLFGIDTAGQGAEQAKALVDTFYTQTIFHNTRRLVEPLAAFSADQLMLAEPAIAIVCEGLSNRVPCFKSALQWPQVQSIGSRLISNELDNKSHELSKDQGTEWDELSMLDKCEMEAPNLLPAEWLRLNAGLTVAEKISLSASDLFLSSNFFKRAHSMVEDYSLTYDVEKTILENPSVLLPPLPESERHRAEQIESLMLKLYPFFAEEIKPLPVLDIDPEQWKLAVAHNLCNWFNETIFLEATTMFATDAGQELLFKFPQIMFALKELTQSDAFASLAEEAVQTSFEKIDKSHAVESDEDASGHFDKMDLEAA